MRRHDARVRPGARALLALGVLLAVALGGCADNFALNPSPKMKKLSVLPSEPRCRGFQDLQGLLVLDLFETSDRVLRDVPLRRTLTCGVHTQGSGCGTERRVPPDYWLPVQRWRGRSSSAALSRARAVVKAWSGGVA